jgi:hypothetical protein
MNVFENINNSYKMSRNKPNTRISYFQESYWISIQTFQSHTFSNSCKITLQNLRRQGQDAHIR